MVNDMRIAQVTPVYPPYAGGIGTIAHEYTERLRARGFDVHVTTPAYKGQIHASDPHYVHRMAPTAEWGNAAFLPRLQSVLSTYDIIHLHYPFFGGAELFAFESDRRIPLVVTYHMDVVALGLKRMVFSAHRRALMPAIMRQADRILVSSMDYAETSDIKLLLDDRRVVEMPFGVDLDRFHPGSGVSVRTRFGIPPTDAVILFVGGLDDAHYFKGIAVLLDALELLTNEHWHAMVVGSGNLQKSYETMVGISRVKDRVHFAGSVPVEELPDFYRAANVHVLPSTDRSEAFGVVTLEAAASGIPSIVSDLPGVRTVVVPEETGFHFPVGDRAMLAQHLDAILSNPTLAERMGEAARRRAESEYAWDGLMDRLEGVYRSVARRV